MRWCWIVLVILGSANADPLPIGHRGLPSHAPENSLAGFSACLQMRLGFELDVQRTKDGHLIVLHDGTLDRTTDGTGPASALTLAEIRKLDAGSKFDPQFRGTRIPTFEEVFALMVKEGQPDTIVTVDIKLDDERIENDLVTLAQRFRVLDRLVFIGRAIQVPAVRKRLRTADPKAHVACLAQTKEDLPMAIADPDSDWVYARFVPTAAEVEQIHKAGKKVILVGPLFSAREADNWNKGREAGADAIMTDHPLEMRIVFRGKGKSP